MTPTGGLGGNTKIKSRDWMLGKVNIVTRGDLTTTRDPQRSCKKSAES